MVSKIASVVAGQLSEVERSKRKDTLVITLSQE